MKREKIFVSYSHKDKKLFDEFKTVLAPAIRKGIVDIGMTLKLPLARSGRKKLKLLSPPLKGLGLNISAAD
jgi:hypothetical protein